MATFVAKRYEQVVESVLAAMTAAPSPLTDRSVGSVTRTLAEAFSWEIAYLQRQLLQTYLWGFVDTAEGDALDRVVALLGVVRRRQETAIGQVVFKRRAGIAGEIVIPVGTRVSTTGEEPHTFETTELLRLEAEDASGTVQVRALEAGAPGVVGPKQIQWLNRPIAGIGEIENPEGTALGAPTETDEQLRERAKRALERAGKATVNAIRYGLLEVPGVRGVSVSDEPSADPGVVRVTVDIEDGYDSLSNRQRLMRTLDDLRAAGIRVRHNLGSDTDPGVALREVPLDLACYLTFEPESLPADEQGRATADVQRAITAYLKGVELGQPVSINRMVALAMGVPGVGDVEVTLQVSDDPERQPAPDGRLRPEPGERFALSSLKVDLARRPVYLDVTVAAEIPAEIGLQAENVEDEIRRLLQARLAEVAAQTVGSGLSLTAADLKNQMEYNRLYRITAIQVDATFPQRGLMLRGVSAVDLVRRDAPELRSLKVTVAGGGGR